MIYVRSRFCSRLDGSLTVPSVDDLHTRTGIDIPIHVDGASGAFTAPFAYPDYEWAFSVSRVNSINASGHKFGMTYPGLGWLLFKDESLLPKVRPVNDSKGQG